MSFGTSSGTHWSQEAPTLAVEYQYPLDPLVTCDLRLFNMDDSIGLTMDIHQDTELGLNRLALSSIQSQWQLFASYASTQLVGSIPEILNEENLFPGFTIGQEDCIPEEPYEHVDLMGIARQNFGRPYIHQSSYCIMNNEIATPTPRYFNHSLIAPDDRQQLEGIYEERSLEDLELVASATSETGDRVVYATPDHGGGHSHGKIRVCRPPGVRWNETMQCAYISPITGFCCKVKLNRGPDLERHLRTVHLRQEAQAVTDAIIPRNHARLLSGSWKVHEKGCSQKAYQDETWKCPTL
ncbi:unnamed protein product [Rhizoctonia solani]|nr:unnamed protein product [Rhizoctonia solani]